jgi:predicted porin
LTYDFSKVGVNGLKGIVQRAWTDQGSMGAASTADYTSYAAGLDYAVPSFKGLTFGLQYESQEKETSNASGVVTSAIDTNELRFRATYKF